MDAPEIDKRFGYHRPRTGDVARCHEIIRDAARDFANTVLDFSPECREQSLAITKIEEAMMWANAAIARNQDQVVNF